MPNLGLVCITTSDRVRYRTMTRKRLLQLSDQEQRRALEELYSANLERLSAAIDFCEEQGIKLYRLSSSLFPFADDRLGEEVLGGFSETMRQIGERATALGIRLVMHPDQFVVLSSDSEAVIENSIKILRTRARTLDMLAQPRTSWAAMQLHGGKGDRAARLVRVIRDLPDNIHTRLALENDERAYGAMEILEVCRAAGVAMVFDAHHHIVHKRLDSYDDPSIEEMLALARETWPAPEWQMVHISNGRETFNDSRHSDLITALPAAYRDVPWIEVEAKLKEVAIEKLRADWLD